MNEGDMVSLLMQSPLYRKLEDIKNAMSGAAPLPGSEPSSDKPYLDERDDTLFSADDELSPVDLSCVSAREFVVHKFSTFVQQLLAMHCYHKPVTILLANEQLSGNAYRNSFSYDPNNRILYLRRDRLENV